MSYIHFSHRESARGYPFVIDSSFPQDTRVKRAMARKRYFFIEEYSVIDTLIIATSKNMQIQFYGRRSFMDSPSIASTQSRYCPAEGWRPSLATRPDSVMTRRLGVKTSTTQIEKLSAISRIDLLYSLIPFRIAHGFPVVAPYGVEP